MSHKPGGGLPLLSARPAVTPATLKRAATNFAARWTEAQWVRTVCYPIASRLRFEPGPFCAWVQHANHSATEPPHYEVLFVFTNAPRILRSSWFAQTWLIDTEMSCNDSTLCTCVEKIYAEFLIDDDGISFFRLFYHWRVWASPVFNKQRLNRSWSLWHKRSISFVRADPNLVIPLHPLGCLSLHFHGHPARHPLATLIG